MTVFILNLLNVQVVTCITVSTCVIVQWYRDLRNNGHVTSVKVKTLQYYIIQHHDSHDPRFENKTRHTISSILIQVRRPDMRDNGNLI